MKRQTIPAVSPGETEDTRTITINSATVYTPEQRASCFSILTVGWLSSLFTKGHQQTIQMADLNYLKHADHSSVLLDKFKQTWKYEQQHATNQQLPSIYRALKSAFGRKMYTALPFQLIYQLAQFASPVILSMYLDTIQDPDSNLSFLYILAAALFVASMIQTFSFIHYWQRVYTVGMRCRGALIAACYEKSFKLTLSARGERTMGEIINLITSDCRKIRDVTLFLWVLCIAPLQIILCLYLLYEQISWSVFVSIGTQIVLILPLQIFIGKKIRKLQTQLMKVKDERFKMVNELFGSMKVVRMYAWETSFEASINKIRERELRTLTKFVWWTFTMSVFFILSPLIIATVSFSLYTMVEGKELTATKAFTSITLFAILGFPLAMLPNVIVSVIEANISFKRIARFLNSEEIDPFIIEYTQNNDTNNKKNAISLRNASFAWDDEMNIKALDQITCEFKTGDITMIIGETGSGKSTLLASILGQINKIDGSLMYYESPFSEDQHISVSYSTQEAWIQNATVRENILFGKEYNEDWYNEVVASCALLSDFEQFDNGDSTEIGERGINLSGGQKQRVSLARAVYADADCILLDDPLSAVDPQVGTHIFAQCFVNLLKKRGKTIILSTHAVSFLKEANKIIVMNQGTIEIQGTLQNLLDANINLTRFVIQSKDDPTDDDTKENITELIPANTDKPTTHTHHRRRSSSGFAVSEAKESEAKKKDAAKNKGQLIEEEERAEGAIGFSTITSYFVGVACCVIFMIFFFMIITQSVMTFANFWIALWSDDAYKQPVWFYVIGFVIIQCTGAIGLVFSNIFTVMARITASKKLHNALLVRVIHAPMSFFDTTPIGRIINRFSKDMNNIDQSVPRAFTMLLRFSLYTIANIVAVCVVSWQFALSVLPLSYLYYRVQRYFISTMRDLRRLSALMNSPIFSHFSETLDGVHVLQAFKKSDAFCAQNLAFIDNDQQTYYPSFMANQWLAIRLKSIANVAIGFAAFTVAFISPSPGFAGLALSSVMTITGILNRLTQIKAQFEQDAVSIERLNQYNEIDQEAAYVIEANRPAAEWPQSGKIELHDIHMKYRDNLQHVLRGMSCVIEGGQKVGIIGRTGAGKSSLFVTLLRICEYDQGYIKIDGIDIKNIGLHDLRRKISVIPQDAVLFIGSVRQNLDPFQQSNDEQLMEALKLSHCYDALRKIAIEAEIKRERREARKQKRKEKSHANVKRYKNSLRHLKGSGNEAEESSSASVSSMGSVSASDFLDDPKYEHLNPLDIIVDENGSNFSVGQKQLLCLSRAIVRKSKILLLDEATSAVDHFTDHLIQETIRKVFKNDTILTIAHRIETVLDYDKIMILDNGSILEFDSPNNLINEKQSKFREIVTESFGVDIEEVLKAKGYLRNNV